MSLCRPLLLRFQFHKGTIKTMLTSNSNSRLQYFNSIKVQLRLLSQRLTQKKILLFQFHKGTIKTKISRL